MKIRDSPDKGYPAPATASSPVSRFFLRSNLSFYSARRPHGLRVLFFFRKAQTKMTIRVSTHSTITLIIPGEVP